MSSSLDVFTCAPGQPWRRGTYAKSQLPTVGNPPVSNTVEFAFANLNVLFSTTALNSWVTQSNVRFPYIANKLLPSMDMDVIGFNEVCPSFEKYIFASKPLQSTSTSLTYVSDSSRAKAANKPHYVSLLSRLPVITAFTVPILECNKSAVVICVEKNGEAFIVCSAHLTAQEKNEKLRVRQLTALLRTIRDPPCEVPVQYRECVSNKRVCIMGDFNYHLPSETQHIYDAGYVDCWTRVHGSGRPGHTWDGRNSWWLPFDNRRMRLDRIAIPAQSTYHPVACEVFARTAIPRARAALPCYAVTPSDHYGVSVRLRSGRDTRRAPPHVKGVTHINRTFRQIIAMRVVAVALLAAISVYVMSLL